MHPRQEIPEPLLRLAQLQAGVLSREQVRGHGVTDHVLARLKASGFWQALAPGLYYVLPSPPTWDALAWGGVLLGGSEARLGPQSSGFLHTILPEPPPVVDVLVPAGGRYRTAGPWAFTRENPGVRSPRSAGSPPRLNVEDTVLDLTAIATTREIVHLVTRAVQHRRTRAPRLAAALADRPRHPHRQLLEDLFGDVGTGFDSALELTYLRDVERAHHLPEGHRQASRRGLPYLSDVGYDDWALLVELDGRLGHEGEGRFRDMNRDNRFVLAALITLRYGWIDVLDRPCEVAAQVAAILIRHGWSGLPSRCPRCLGATESDLWAAC